MKTLFATKIKKFVKKIKKMGELKMKSLFANTIKKVGVLKMRKLIAITMLLVSITLGSSSAHATAISANYLYGMSVQAGNTNIYQINPATGVVTIASTTAQFPSTGIAFDGNHLYYWNHDNVTNQGIGKWDPWTDTHSIINGTDWLEENAGIGMDGTIWILDRSYTYDPVSGTFIDAYTDELYTVNKATGARTFFADIDTAGTTGGFGAGDIAWGPDNKLYISTINVTYGYDSYNNYTYDPGTGNLDAYAGEYYAGLTWINNKLYGSLGEGSPTQIFELNSDFSQKALVATMPGTVTIGDLSNAVPEPASIFMLGFGSLILLRNSRKKTSR